MNTNNIPDSPSTTETSLIVDSFYKKCKEQGFVLSTIIQNYLEEYRSENIESNLFITNLLQLLLIQAGNMYDVTPIFAVVEVAKEKNIDLNTFKTFFEEAMSKHLDQNNPDMAYSIGLPIAIYGVKLDEKIIQRLLSQQDERRKNR